NPAAYLVNSEEENEILFNTNKNLSKEQYKQAECLLHDNDNIFAQKISKDEQTVGLEQTNLKSLL
ncbi:20809_t:CDS:2, partial [Gigaspora rosea]